MEDGRWSRVTSTSGGGTERIRVYKLKKGIEIHLLFTVKAFSWLVFGSWTTTYGILVILNVATSVSASVRGIERRKSQVISIR